MRLGRCAKLLHSGSMMGAAGGVMRIAEQYFSPNISLEEMRAVTRSLEADPLKSFGEACRAELKSIRATG